MKLFGRLSHFLIFLSAAAYIFLIAEAGMESTDRAKRQEGRRYRLYIQILYSPRILFSQVQVFKLAIR